MNKDSKSKEQIDRSGVGYILADLFLGVLKAATPTEETNTTSQENKMIKLENNIDPIRALELMAKIGRFVRENARDPDDIVVETSLIGEITIKVRSKIVAEAKKDFMNIQSWSIRVDERIISAFRNPSIF